MLKKDAKSYCLNSLFVEGPSGWRFGTVCFGLDTPWYSRKLNHGYRIAGVKLSFDGSPQGKTAYLSQPYFIPPHGLPFSYRGYPAMHIEDANRKIALCYEKDW